MSEKYTGSPDFATCEGEVRYIILPDSIMGDPNLTPQQKLILGIIWSFSSEGQECFASNAYLAKRAGCGTRAVQVAISKAIKSGWLNRRLEENKRYLRVIRQRGAQPNVGGCTSDHPYNTVDTSIITLNKGPTKKQVVEEEITVEAESWTPEAQKALTEWIQYRASIKKKLVAPTVKRLIKKWDGHQQEFVTAVDHSIMNGYRGLWLPDVPGGQLDTDNGTPFEKGVRALHTYFEAEEAGND